MAGPLTPRQRTTYLDFVTKNAGDDIVIAAALRTMYNIQEARELDTFIRDYRPSLSPGDYVGTKATHTGMGTVEHAAERAPEPPPEKVIDNPEDLGPVPKKLGTNGQAIWNLMKKEGNEWTVDGLRSRLKLSEAKIKPMLALLIARKIVRRVTNFTYEIV